MLTKQQSKEKKSPIDYYWRFWLTSFIRREKKEKKFDFIQSWIEGKSKAKSNNNNYRLSKELGSIVTVVDGIIVDANTERKNLEPNIYLVNGMKLLKVKSVCKQTAKKIKDDDYSLTKRPTQNRSVNCWGRIRGQFVPITNKVLEWKQKTKQKTTKTTTVGTNSTLKCLPHSLYLN